MKQTKTKENLMRGVKVYINYEDIKQEFGKRLKYQRAMFGVSQEKLAEIIGCSTQYIYQIESGKCKPSIDALLSISDYFGVSIDYLLKGNDNNSNDILDAVLKDFSPHQRESLAHTIMLIRSKRK